MTDLNLLNRAATALARKSKLQPYLRDFRLEAKASRTYVTWRPAGELLAVYRVRPDGRLRSLARWPRALTS